LDTHFLNHFIMIDILYLKRENWTDLPASCKEALSASNHNANSVALLQRKRENKGWLLLIEDPCRLIIEDLSIDTPRDLLEAVTLYSFTQLWFRKEVYWNFAKHHDLPCGLSGLVLSDEINPDYIVYTNYYSPSEDSVITIQSTPIKPPKVVIDLCVEEAITPKKLFDSSAPKRKAKEVVVDLCQKPTPKKTRFSARSEEKAARSLLELKNEKTPLPLMGKCLKTEYKNRVVCDDEAKENNKNCCPSLQLSLLYPPNSVIENLSYDDDVMSRYSLECDL